jgi:23S rRNA pseudouridine1911/1915/1917 synthase
LTRGAPPVPILFEDSHLLVVFKPPGWVVQGAHEGHGRLSLREELGSWIRLRDEKPGKVFLAVVHRLDRPVSGIVVLAKRTKAASRISKEIRERRFEKIYRAVVEGVPEPARGKCAGLLRWEDSARRARIVAAHGELGAGSGLSSELSEEGLVEELDPQPKAAKLARVELEYALLEAGLGGALVEVRPTTGRKHQIRAQFAHLGFPIAGDFKYGARSRLPEGIALLAYRVRFRHPVRAEDVMIQVPGELDPTHGWLASLDAAPRVTNAARGTRREER